REGVDASALLESMRTEAPDLLLELPGLRSIRIEEYESWSAAEDFGNGLRKVWITTGGRESSWWEYTAPRARWLLPIRDDQAVAAAPDVLRAPTRTDEELSLPALLIADIALQPDRRRLLPGARLAELAEGYADFARALPPADRCVLIPVPGFARSEADGRLREALLAELREGAWLPVVPTADRPEPAVAVPARSSVFLGATAELAGLLGELVEPLVVAELSGRGTADLLASVDVHRLGLARIAELTAGADHPPSWWYSLYDALEPFVTDPLAAEELGALGVLLSDGRVVTGPRTVLLDDQLHDAIAVPWARLVHPEAAHELLGRLGARAASIEDLLTDPALRAELDHRPDDEDLRAAVLRLAAHLSPGTVLPSWLGALEFPDDTGELRPADELLLPGAPLADVLVPDSPFGTLDADLARRYPDSAWRAIGVGWAFAVVSESDPTGPDHDLDDEDLWWDDLAEDPPEFTAVRDLDLVDDDAWPQALRLLLDDPATRPLLGDRDGYTAWWLRRYARIDGHPLGVFGTGADPVLDGVLPRLPGMSETDLPALAAVLADPDKITTQLALALLDALADASKTPSPEAISHIHARLGDAATHLDLEMFDAPERVRALSGAVIDPEDALVLDQPWFGQVLPPDRLVVGDIRSAATLATLLDVPLVSEAVQAEIVGAGRRTTWAAEPLGVLLRLQFGIPAPAGDLVLHERLEVRLGGAEQTTVAVQWWREGDTTHVQRPGAGG
ncbi:MAG: ATP-binding protein, partial [Nocardia sp.]|nr:ATP-binding protein [Nocardia sp.]